jgi:tetratricopeptide (TPR) repeat protein
MDISDIMVRIRAARGAESKVQLYLQACREIQYSEPHQALEYATEARKIARKAGLTSLEIHAQRMQGICLYASNDFEGALDVFQKTLPRYKKARDRSGMARALQNVGMALRGLGRNEEALAAYRESEVIVRERGEDDVLAAVLTNIGAIWSVLDRPKDALESYSECLALAERLDDDRWRARIMGNIADIYISVGDLQTGIEWSQRSLDLHRSTGDHMGVGLTLANLGRVYQILGDLDASLAMLSESLTVMSTLHDAHARARTMVVLSSVLLAKKRTAEARTMAEDAVVVFEASKDVERTVASLIVLGEAAIMAKDVRSARSAFQRAEQVAAGTDNYRVHVNITRNRANIHVLEGKVPAAIKLYNEAVTRAEETNMHAIAAELHVIVSDLYAGRGQWKEAIQHERAARKQQRLADNELRAQHSQALQMRLDIERTARERDRLHAEQEKLEMELSTKERELSTNALLIAQKNELLSAVTDDIKDAAKGLPSEQATFLKNIVKRIESHRRTGEDWKNFSEQLKDVQESFLTKLAQHAPNLAPTETKVASLLKLGLSSKEISEILTVSLGTVEQYRHRIRKKLGMTGDTALFTFLQSLDQ